MIEVHGCTQATDEYEQNQNAVLKDPNVYSLETIVPSHLLLWEQLTDLIE